MRTRILAALASGAMLLGGSGAHAQPNGDTSANWDAVVRCAQKAGVSARHDCIDRLLREKGVLDAQRELSEARQSFGQDRRAEPKPAPAEAPVPAAAAAPRAEVAASSGSAPSAPPELKALQTQVTSARVAADRMLVITTTEGAIWKQIETVEIRFPPVKGDSIEIEQTALGGHRCKLGKIFRCQRVG